MALACGYRREDGVISVALDMYCFFRVDYARREAALRWRGILEVMAAAEFAHCDGANGTICDSDRKSSMPHDRLPFTAPRARHRVT